MSQEMLNSIGLGLDIVGVILLFRFAVAPAVTDTPSFGLKLEGPDIDRAEAVEKLTAKKYHRISNLGIALMVIGFVLQIISNHFG